MKLPSLTRNLAIAASGLAIMAGAVMADETPQPPLWENSAGFEPIANAIYSPNQVGHPTYIDYVVQSKYGLPEVAERHTLTNDGAEIVVYYDPHDEAINFQDKNNVTHPSLDDTDPGRLAAVVFYDGDNTAYILGLGALRADEVPENGQIEDGVTQYNFILNDFMRNQENGQSWISLASDVNYENLANHGFTQLDGVTIGGNSPVSISMLSGPSGDFMQATGYQISGPYSQQVVTANFGQVRTSVPPLDDNDLISSAGGEIILASAELSN